ncbi:MAG: PAS domain S-box protein [Marinobacterium sp.]|nr:PAS domain S-box protein [Marinobacterium sp.]
MKLSPRIRLVSLFMLALVLLLILGQTAAISRKHGLEELQQRSLTDLNRYRLSLSQKLERYRNMPELLATHWELIQLLQQTDDSDRRRRASLYLQQVNNILGTSDVYLMDTSGTTIAASNEYTPRSFMGRNFAFRPYFQDAIAGRPGAYSAVGLTSGKRGYYFSYPVQRYGQILGVVVVKIDLNDIEDDWNDSLLDILVVDDDDVVFISTRRDWKFSLLSPRPQSELARIASSQRYGRHPLQALEVMERKRRLDGSTLITLIDHQRREHDKKAGPVEYLQQSAPLEGYGLRVVALAQTRLIKQNVWEAVVLVAFIYVALALLVLFLLTRRRAALERVRFKQQRTRALEENESRIRAIIDNTRAGLITLDRQGRIDSFNPTAEKLFGYQSEQVRGDYFSTLLSQPDRPLCWAHITADDQQRAAELALEATGVRQNDSQFPLELVIGQMKVGRQLRFIATVHDITERKESERQLRQAHDELESRVQARTVDLTETNARLRTEIEQHDATRNELIQTAKLAVLGQLAAGINHELNQPLTAIRAYADNACAFLKMGRLETVETNLTEISGLTERMARIIHPLKEFSRNSSGKPEPVNLRALRDGAMSILYGQLHRRRIEIEWPQRLEQYYVLGDMLRLEQVMVNLIRNALQAMETHAPLAAQTVQLQISVEEQGAQLAIRIRDHGPGIAEADLSRIFEPFFTTKSAGQGLGLGLSISYRIIESLNGRLSASNHPQGGAVFTLTLPRCEPVGLDAQAGDA